MSINRLNYEEYLADYLEGSLDPVLSAELMVFLSENPDLEKQFYELEPRSHGLQAETFPYPFKEGLKKDFADVGTIHALNVDEFCIADIEGLLKEEDKKRLLNYLDIHPQKAVDYEIFRKTLLRPDPLLQFRDKERLKKPVTILSHNRFSAYVIRIAAAAAAVILVMLLNPGEKSLPTEYAPADFVTDALPEKTVLDGRTETVPAEKAVFRPQPAALAEKKPFPVSEALESAVALPVLSAIPSALLPYPYPEVSPVEITLLSQSPVPESAGLIASHPAGKKPVRDIPDLWALVQKVDVWKTAERVIDGVNYLTESRIQLYSTLDDQGKLTDLLIRSEAFRLESRRNN